MNRLRRSRGTEAGGHYGGGKCDDDEWEDVIRLR